jgi:hypothetical protein
MLTNMWRIKLKFVHVKIKNTTIIKSTPEKVPVLLISRSSTPESWIVLNLSNKSNSDNMSDIDSIPSLSRTSTPNSEMINSRELVLI